MANYNFLNDAKVWFQKTSSEEDIVAYTNRFTTTTVSGLFWSYKADVAGIGSEPLFIHQTARLFPTSGTNSTGHDATLGDRKVLLAFDCSSYAAGEATSATVVMINVVNGVKYLRVKIGSQITLNNTSDWEELNRANTDGIHVDIPFSQLSPFNTPVRENGVDGLAELTHIRYEIDPPNKTFRMWINSTLVAEEVSANSFRWIGDGDFNSTANKYDKRRGGFGAATQATNTNFTIPHMPTSLYSDMTNRDEALASIPYNISSLALTWFPIASQVGGSTDLYHNQTAVNFNAVYPLPIKKDLTFSQTFTDNNYSVKTIQNTGNMFKASSINKANPADVSFSIPVFESFNGINEFYDIIRKLNTENSLSYFTLYVQLPNDFYTIEKCVVVGTTFKMEKTSPLEIEVKVQGSKISRGTNTTFIQPFIATSYPETYQLTTDHLVTTIDSTPIDCLISLSAELQNEVQWVENNTVDKAIETGSFNNANHSFWNIVDTTPTYSPTIPMDRIINNAPVTIVPTSSYTYIGEASINAARDRITLKIFEDPKSTLRNNQNTQSAVDFEENFRLDWDSSLLSLHSHSILFDRPSAADLTNPYVDETVTVNAAFFRYQAEDISVYSSSQNRIWHSLTFSGTQYTDTSVPVQTYLFEFDVLSATTDDVSFELTNGNGSSFSASGNTFAGKENPLKFQLNPIPAEQPHVRIVSATGEVSMHYPSNNFSNSEWASGGTGNYTYTVQSINDNRDIVASKDFSLDTDATQYSNQQPVAGSVIDTVNINDFTPDSDKNTTYPQEAVIISRTFSGSVEQYVTDSTDHKYVQTHKTGVPIVIEAGKNSTSGFQFNLGNCTFTNRNNVADAFTQNFDWLMNDNPADLSTILKINNT